VDEESKLANLQGEAAKNKQKEITEVAEILKEMEDRVSNITSSHSFGYI
jgi:two-component sensor histidine kinase